MRILHVIPQFPYFGGTTVVGGHASSLMTLGRAQARRGDRVTILSYVEGRAGSIPITEGLEVFSLFEHARPGTVRFGLAFRHAAAQWARARRDDFDLVHGHSGFADYLVVTDRLRRDLRLPSLHTMYCPIPERGGRWRAPVVHGILRRAAAGLDARVAMSRNVAGSMEAYGMSGVRVVPPPVDIARFRPPDDAHATRADLGLADGDVAVLFVGNAKPQKNLDGVLRAFRVVHERHPSARLVVTTELAQSSSDARLATLRSRMNELGIADRVVQKGIVDDMPALMQACDVLVAPFLDSFGPSDYFMAVLEAMACGRPVVVSAVGGMPEVISEDVGRLVDPADDDAIASALAWFVADGARRRAAGAHARTYTERHFDPDAVAAAYEAIYGDIAGEAPGSMPGDHAHAGGEDDATAPRPPTAVNEGTAP